MEKSPDIQSGVQTEKPIEVVLEDTSRQTPQVDIEMEKSPDIQSDVQTEKPIEVVLEDTSRQTPQADIEMEKSPDIQSDIQTGKPPKVSKTSKNSAPNLVKRLLSRFLRRGRLEDETVATTTPVNVGTQESLEVDSDVETQKSSETSIDEIVAITTPVAVAITTPVNVETQESPEVDTDVETQKSSEASIDETLSIRTK